MAEFGFNNEFSADAAQPPTAVAPAAISNFVSEEMECPHNKVGMVIGSKGVIIQEIMHRSNCKVVVYQDGLPDGQPRNVVITGAPGQVVIAKQLITAVIQEGPTILQTQAPGVNSNEPTVTEEMSCPPEKVGLVIGSKGIIIQEIMRRSYCKITVNQNFPDGEPRMVNITGKAPQIEIAKALVAIVIANGPSALNQSGLGVASSSNVTEEMDCPQEKVGIVIGAKGVIVQDIMRRCGCKITINQDFPDGQPRRVVFTGSPHQVEMGKNLVNAVIAHGPSAVQNMGGRGEAVQDLKIVQSQVGKLIGPGGSTIKDIQQRCGVKMNVDHIVPDSDERRLRITGDAARVNAAQQMVFQVLHGGGNLGMNGPPQQGYGMPMVGGYGNEGAPMMHPGYGMPPAGYGNADAMQQMGPVGQGLGADGSSGRLMPATSLANGMVLQIVYILKNLMSHIAGKDFATLALIMSKSAAQVQIEQASVMASGGQEMCKINVVGAPASVSLAGQMIQEVLINGPDKLAALPDPVYSGLEEQRGAAPQQFNAPQQFGQAGSMNGASGDYMNMQQQGQMYQQPGQFYGNANASHPNPYYQQQQQQQGQQK